jgi:hypothetical protein
MSPDPIPQQLDEFLLMKMVMITSAATVPSDQKMQAVGAPHHSLMWPLI